MARIAFIQEIWHEYIGTMSIAASLKAKGHLCDVFIPDGEKDLVSTLRSFNPDTLAFSCLTGGHRWALEKAGQLKKELGKPTIFGGIHPTLFPQIIEHPNVDIVCVGEGEETLAEVADNLPNLNKLKQVKGIWFKTGGAIKRNNERPLIANLSAIPIPDRSLYLKYPLINKNPSKHFMAGRGCPYNCTFCYNDSLKKMYTGSKFLRLRENDHLLKEIFYVKQNSKLETVVFDDDTFTTSRRWLKEFLESYKKEIDISYVCNVRVEHVDDNLARMLAQSGCFRVCMGIECGSESIRRNVLKKNFTNDEAISAAAIIKKHGIRILTNNMMGIPDETVADALETVKLNVRIKTDYPWCSIFQPYPGTPLADYAIKKGYMPSLDVDSFDPTFFEGSMLNMKDINAIVNLQKFFYVAVRFPWTIPLIKKLAYWPFRKIYHFIFLVFFAYRYARSNRLGVRDILGFGFQSIGLYLKKKTV
ncbi:MAG: B12-binding domain-containing radical SAM protein [Deltaproteobacteria bacterium]|nr:B12-binding domain-containing radical SAM protein [Deltaproteobacteria bacterium]